MSQAKLLRNTPEEEAAINRGIASDPDTYELPAEEFKQLRPFPEVMAERRMGRPPKEHRKEQVSVRYDADIMAAFRDGRRVANTDEQRAADVLERASVEGGLSAKFKRRGRGRS